jgi:hypothetical protein
MYHRITIAIVKQNLMNDRKDLEFRNVSRGQDERTLTCRNASRDQDDNNA